MKYLFWFILPLLGLIIVIQTVVVNPLSGNCNSRRGAAVQEKEVKVMPLYAASKKKTLPINETNQTTNRTSAEGDQSLEQFQKSVDQIFHGLRATVKSEVPSEAQAKAPNTFDARVVKVCDGDTFIVDVNGTEKRIRLAAVDAPETKQLGGAEAKAKLESLVGNKTVTLEPVDTDRYGRIVAFVTVDGKTINEQLVKEGFVWYCREYANGRNYYDAMVFAMQNKIGLWKLAGTLPPALYRKLAMLGKLGANIIKNGLYLDNNGILHNKNIPCKSSYPARMRWNGIDGYENCPVCYGAIFSPRGVLGAYLNDASSEALVEDSFDEDMVTDAGLETHLSDDELPVTPPEKIVERGNVDPYRGSSSSSSSCPTCNTGWGWWLR